MFIAEEKYYYNYILKSNKEDVKNILSVDNKKGNYHEFDIPKKDGLRRICAIDKEKGLYKIQQNLQYRFLGKIPLPNAVKGFIKGEGYTSYLSEHIGNKHFLRIDIESFFDSITIEQIDSSLKEFVNSEEIRNNLIDICSFNGKLPQGAITSPTLSNIIFRFIDQRITKYCQCFDVIYTRYADDMLFSSNNIDFDNKFFFYSKIKYILKENGFNCNKSKKIITNNKISLSGYVISSDIHLSRKKLHNINNLIYYFNKNKGSYDQKFKVDKSVARCPNMLEEVNKLNLVKKDGQTKEFSNKDQLIDFLSGYRSFIISVLKSNNNSSSFIEQMNKKVKYIELIIDELID